MDVSSSKFRFSSVISVPVGDDSYRRGGFCTGFTTAKRLFCCSDGSDTKDVTWWLGTSPLENPLACDFFDCIPRGRRRQQHRQHTINNRMIMKIPATRPTIMGSDSFMLTGMTLPLLLCNRKIHLSVNYICPDKITKKTHHNFFLRSHTVFKI